MSIALAEIFLMVSGGLIALGLFFGAVAAVVYFMGTLDERD